MSNIQIFNVERYGVISVAKDMILNIDGFSETSPINTNQTLVRYIHTLGNSNFISVIINEAYSEVQAKLSNKTSSVSAAISVASTDNDGEARTVNIDSRYFSFAEENFDDSSQTTLYYNSPKENSAVRYVVNSTIVALLTAFSFGATPILTDNGIENITTSPQTITMNKNFGTLNDYVIIAVMANGGGVVSSITPVNGTSFDVQVSAFGEMNWIAQKKSI